MKKGGNQGGRRWEREDLREWRVMTHVYNLNNLREAKERSGSESNQCYR